MISTVGQGRSRRWAHAFIVLLAAILVAGLPTLGTARADTWPDAYTQIVNHQIPITGDGPPSYLWRGWGRYYTGPNGLEIRLTSSGTATAVKFVLTAESVGATAAITGSVSTLGSVLVESVPSATLRNALSTAQILLGGAISDTLGDIAFKNLCLGATIPPDGLDATLTRAGNLMSARLIQAFQVPTYNDLRLWLEPCSSSPTAGQADTLIPVNLPGVDTVMAAQPIVPPPPPPSLLVIRTGTGINGKAGLTSNWTWGFSATPVTDVRVFGNRIFYTDTNGALWAKEGLTGTWYQEYGAVSQYAASGSLLVIRLGTNLFGKVNLTDNWVALAGAVADVRVSGNRISYSDTAGNIWAKDGLYGTWYQEYPAVSQYAMSSSLFVLRDGTSLYGKTCLTCGWVWGFNATPVTDVRVVDNRITYTDTNGALWAKDGLTGSWYQEYGVVSQYAVSGSVLVIRLGTNLFGKVGLSDNWVLLNGTPATDVKVSGSRVIYTDTNGNLWAKDSLYGTWYQEYNAVDQYATS